MALQARGKQAEQPQAAEEEESFGPQPIARLEVCINSSCGIELFFKILHIMKIVHSYKL